MNRRSVDRLRPYADLRIAFEHDADLLSDAIEQYLDLALGVEVLQRVVARLRTSRAALHAYEHANGIDHGRVCGTRTAAEIVLELEVAGEIAAGASELRQPAAPDGAARSLSLAGSVPGAGAPRPAPAGSWGGTGLSSR